MLLLFFSLFINLSLTSVEVQEVTKDGIYLNIGTSDGVVEADELYAKQKNKKFTIKILKLSQNHSIACLLDENKKCVYELKKTLKVKDLKFKASFDKKKDLLKEDEIFIRETKAFREITKEEVELFNKSNKVFDLIIFKDDLTKVDKKYKLFGALNLYNIAMIEFLEPDLNSFNNILQGDLYYEDDKQDFKFIFDANMFLQKQNTEFLASIYQLSYSYKYKKFTFKIGRDNFSELNDFYLTDGLFASYKNQYLKFGFITAFGLDYYDDMKTDFNHIYLGGFVKLSLKPLDNFEYSTLLGFVPELFENVVGLFPFYFNNSLKYKDKLDLNYMFKSTYSKLFTEKRWYTNHYLTLNLRLIDNLNLRFGFDSREYLDLINYSYYESIVEKIDKDVSKNISFNANYKISKNLLGFSYKRRFSEDLIDEFTARYTMYYFSAFEASLRITSLLMKDVNIYLSDLNLDYSFSDTLRFSYNLLFVLEDVSIPNNKERFRAGGEFISEKVFGITPQLVVYKKFFSYFYLKGSLQGELKAKRVSGMLKLGYIWD